MSRKRQRRPRPPGRIAVRTLAHEYPSGHQIPRHRHDWHQLVYAERGVMTVETDAGAWTVPPHRAVWVPAAVVHAIRMAGPVSMRTLYFDPRLPGLPRGGCDVLEVAPLLREIILAAVAAGGLRRDVAAEAHLLAVLRDELGRRPLPARPLHLPQPRDPRAVRLAALLRADPGDRRALASLCKRAGASQRTFERVFRGETGLSVGRFRQQLRFAHALGLLAGGQPVTTVALEVGYDSPSAFVAAFRGVFGTTPGRYFATSASPRRR